MLFKKSGRWWRWLIQDRLVILWKRWPVMPSLTHCQIKIWPRKSEKESRLILRLPISMRSGWMLTDHGNDMDRRHGRVKATKEDWKSSGGVVQQTRRLEDLERE